MAGLTHGSLFAGYGGLDLAIADVFGARTAWVAEFEDAPARVLAHHYPDAPNLGDVTRVDWSTVPRVDIISGGSPCFPAGTLIDTSDGYVPIEKVRLGDAVRTHRGRYMPVVRTMSRWAVTDAITVQAMGAPPFVTTTEHPFYVRTKSQVWDDDRRQYVRRWSDPEWVPAGSLATSHFVGYQTDTPDPDATPLGDELAYVVGRWLGDGWLRTGKRKGLPQGQRGSRVTSRWQQVFICCAHEEADELADRLTAAGARAARFTERTVTKFRFNSKALVAMLEEFGSGAAGKRLPGWVYLLPLSDQRSIWQGWVDSDGSTDASGKVRVTTVSPELAHGMARLARNVFGRATSVHRFISKPTTVIEGRTVNQRDQYQVVLPAANREAIVDDGWVWAPVRSVTPAAPVEVFNIGVREDESYTAWGIAVHNCQDLSHAGRRAGMTEGTRSNLWVAMREAIDVLRPAYVVWENVRGAMSAEATSELEHCPGCMGDPRDRGPVLRALGRVLGDLADLGFDAEWYGVRAADVGACHGRWRVFVLAYAHGARPQGQPHPSGAAPAERHGHPVAGAGGPDLALLPTPRVENNENRQSEGYGGVRGNFHGLLTGAVPWGEYAEAIARHERTFGRPAPDPTEPGPKGNPRLSAAFVEWMMALPAGWVTDRDVSRNEALKMLGNGVVPPQAAHALRVMLGRLP